MRKNILVIGGTRFIGKLLVQRLLAAGHQVTIATRGRAQDPFGERIRRLKVDRRDEASLRRALQSLPHDTFDVVYDQMCYSPLDAAIATRVFAGRTRRYIMASTIDVYRDLPPAVPAPHAEDAFCVLAQPIDASYPWHDPKLAVESYVAGKRQAEGYLYRDGQLPMVTVRMAHVLSGPDDFTRRLGYYVDLLRSGHPLRYTNAVARSSFISAQGAAAFLAWAGMQTFTGPVNAAADGALSTFDLYHRAAMVLGAAANAVPATAPGAPGEHSPFDHAYATAMDTTRARQLGYRFGHLDDWLDDTIRQHDLAFV
ncbi:NAD-dependent epimerase/dehydratase family protein [Massilia arenosa]|uniref:UDP-glucose 4-epimerase n=1 Tax=Zemynaea arenosa TaxID=2561931 RepID=A0A4Y9SB52_9BURK|nr:NAD-dependent epimerase/dehydratase family protein [Massilia arenosa]TFW19043.1 NAD-dependent epimerase/dehydratase family protein [Massilia arenosa]